MKYTKKEITEFIKESNAIEGVWADQAIQDSLQAWEWLTEEMKEITLMDILIAHKGILCKLEPNIAGKLRSELRVDVQVGGRICVRYYDVPNRISQWIVQTRILKWDDEVIKGIHIAFEKIHPFADGNGRIGRLLYCWMREKANLPIHIIYEKDKQNYYEWFRE